MKCCPKGCRKWWVIHSVFKFDIHDLCLSARCRHSRMALMYCMRRDHHLFGGHNHKQHSVRINPWIPAGRQVVVPRSLIPRGR